MATSVTIHLAEAKILAAKKEGENYEQLQIHGRISAERADD